MRLAFAFDEALLDAVSLITSPCNSAEVDPESTESTLSALVIPLLSFGTLFDVVVATFSFSSFDSDFNLVSFGSKILSKLVKSKGMATRRMIVTRPTIHFKEQRRE
ncbi:hypothetical protein QCA50_012881 [Cerrena zonata]|uniref:Uncharacterized protein n=1 Tax=Cerrena zonata TaxID=2478898 RepID=A0AAW0FRH0_9APHY